TSNLGSQIIAELAEAGDEPRMRREIQNVLRAAFLPEFLNRIDETIIFHPLGMEELTRIVDIQLRRLERQLSEAGLTLRITDEAKARLAQEGFDPAYGARPLKRVIQQRLANPLATALLEQRVAEGDTVEIGWDAQRQEFTFDSVGATAAKARRPYRRSRWAGPVPDSPWDRLLADGIAAQTKTPGANAASFAPGV